MELPERIRRHIEEQGLLPPGAGVLIACSGGGDSLAATLILARLRHALGLDVLHVAHLDHGLRPDSGDDAQFVREVAQAAGLPFTVERRAVDRRRDESPESAARRVRYGFLLDAASAHDCDIVVTAHHADDQAETLLLRLLHGTGSAGLRGIREQRALTDTVSVVRPLLPFRRTDLRAWLSAEDVRWREDPTNRDGNPRARLRERAFPVLAECVGRDPVPLLARLAANVADEQALRDVTADDIARRFVTHDHDAVHLAAGYRVLPAEALRPVLAAAVSRLRARPLARAEQYRLLDALAGNDAHQVSDLVVVSDGTTARIVRRDTDAAIATTPALDLEIPGAVTVPWAECVLRAGVTPAGNEPFLTRLAATDGRLEIADADAVSGPLVVTGALPGDRLRVLGAAASQRLGHLLQRRGVGERDRAAVPIVRDAEGIVWVAGVALADRLRVTATSRRVPDAQFVAPGLIRSGLPSSG